MPSEELKREISINAACADDIYYNQADDQDKKDDRLLFGYSHNPLLSYERRTSAGPSVVDVFRIHNSQQKLIHKLKTLLAAFINCIVC